MKNVFDNNRKRALCVSAFCEIYSVGRTLAYSEIATGRLASFTIGRKRLIHADAAEAWLASYAAQASQTAA